MTLRVVFDTKVLFSAVGWDGKPAECVGLARAGHIHGQTCVEILEELAAKLSTKLAFDDHHIGIILGSLMVMLEVVPITGSLRGPQPDPSDDNNIIECAVAGQATHIVTGDRRHLLARATLSRC